MGRRWIIAGTLIVGAAFGGSWAAAEISGNTVNACVNNTSYVVRIRPAAGCVSGETPATWNVTGPQGIQGEPGKDGSPDTPQQVLDKIVQVDGQGSGLDSSFLDGIDSTGFLRSNGKAVDADKLDGISSGGFVKRGTASSGVIGLSSISANKCSDVVLGLGSVKLGDIVVLNVVAGDKLPAGLTMQELDVPADGKLNVRICNGTNTASLADSDIKIRWYAFRP
jgi:hypothetical protein